MPTTKESHESKKKIALLYVVFLHLLIAEMLLRSDFIGRVEGLLGVLPQELTPHFERMLVYHKKMDSLIPDGATSCSSAPAKGGP